MKRLAKLFLSAALLSSGICLAAGPTAPPRKTTATGKYAVTLELRPIASTDVGTAATKRDSGAMIVRPDTEVRPNHELVAIIKKGDKYIKMAAVVIRYRLLTPVRSHWATLPVERIRRPEGGHGKRTVFGNDVMLISGWYEVTVSVNGGAPTEFHVRIRNPDGAPGRTRLQNEGT